MPSKQRIASRRRRIDLRRRLRKATLAARAFTPNPARLVRIRNRRAPPGIAATAAMESAGDARLRGASPSRGRCPFFVLRSDACSALPLDAPIVIGAPVALAWRCSLQAAGMTFPQGCLAKRRPSSFGRASSWHCERFPNKRFNRLCILPGQPASVVEAAWYVCDGTRHVAVIFFDAVSRDWQYAVYNRTKWGIPREVAEGAGIDNLEAAEAGMRGALQGILLSESV